MIRIYQKLVSPGLAKNCRYQPTCSQYAYQAVGRFGLGRGGLLALARLGRCHPFREGGYDPVPRSEELA
ncbi:MAG: membrane protein insertion efficiency factor YidD [Nitrospiraceae bacterium]